MLADAEFFQAGELEHGEERGHEPAQRDALGEEVGEDKILFCAGAVEQPFHLVGDGRLFVVDFSHDEFFREAAEYHIEGVPQLDAVHALQGTLTIGQRKIGEETLHEILAGDGEIVELGGGFLEFFVLEELVDQFPAWIHFIFDKIGVDGVLALGQEQTALNFHQRRCHDKKLTGDIEVELLHALERVDVLAGDGLDGDVVDIQLVLPDEKKQQIEWAFEDLKFDAIVGVGNHGRAMVAPSGGAARGKTIVVRVAARPAKVR